MVREIAVLRTQEVEAFAQAYRGVANALTEAEGNRGAVLHRGLEDPGSFTPMAGWDRVDAHTALTQRPKFGGFGDTNGPHLAGQPEVRRMQAAA